MNGIDRSWLGEGKKKKKNPPNKIKKKRSRVSRDRISVFEIVYAVTPAPCYFFDGGLSCLDRYPPPMGCIGLFSQQLKKSLLLFRQHNSIDKDIWLEIVDVISSRVRSVVGVAQDFFRRNDVGRGRKVQIRLLGGTTIKKGKTRTWSSWQPVQSLFLLTSAKVTQ